jgi:hypothetical protein
VRLRQWTAAGLVAGACLVGCESGSEPGSGGTAAQTPGPVSPTAEPTSSPPPRTTPPARATTSTPAPNPVEGRCPYLDADTVAGIVGQHISRTTVTPTRPYPGCSFYRPNGELAVDVAISELATPTQAQAKAIAIGGRAANPVNGVADGGVVAVTADGAVLAISKSRLLIVIRINQRSSLEAKELARSVSGRIG